MILFYNPKATRPRNRRLPLSILAIAAVVEGKEDYAIVDGNLDPNPTKSLIDIIKRQQVELLAVTVIFGIAAPDGSLTTPAISPVTIVWAAKGAQIAAISARLAAKNGASKLVLHHLCMCSLL